MPSKNKQMITLRVSREQHERIKQMAEDAGMSLNRFCVSRVIPKETVPVPELPQVEATAETTTPPGVLDVRTHNPCGCVIKGAIGSTYDPKPNWQNRWKCVKCGHTFSR